MSGMDGARDSARRGAARKIHETCVCGRDVFGNGKQHQRSCERHLRERGWPLDRGMRDALRRHHWRCEPYRVVREAEMLLGLVVLDRRAAGNDDPMPWRELRDLVWDLAERADQALARG